MKLSDWAKQQGLSYITAYRWFRQGKLPIPAEQTPSGTLLVYPQATHSPSASAWVYGRVSSQEEKEDLDRPAERCLEFCRARGWTVEKVVKEMASGLNDHRPKLTKLLSSGPTRLVVEHKDRLTRFGWGYWELLLPRLGCELGVLHREGEEPADLRRDLIAVVTSFCGRLYGLRRGPHKAREIKERLRCEEPVK